MSFDSDQIQLEVERIKTSVLKLIDRKYGPAGNEPKFYHNTKHTLAVLAAAEEISNLAFSRGLISERDRQLVTIAAVCHDSHHSAKRRNNELLSANFAKSQMRKAGVFTDAEQDLVWNMIMATQVKFTDKKVYQSARAGNYMDQLLADADLSNLGQPFEQYWQGTSNLYQENHGAPGSTKEVARFGLEFIKKHSFYTKEANQLFPHQADNIVHLQELLS